MCICQRRGCSSAGSASQESELDQERLVHVLDGVFLLAHGHGQGLDPHRAAGELLDDGLQDPAIHLVESPLVHVQAVQRIMGHTPVNRAVSQDLGEVPHPPQEAVGDAGGAAAAFVRRDEHLDVLVGHDLVDVRRNLGFIFQAHNLFDSLSAYENVKMAMQLSDCPPDAMRERGMKMLERLGLAHRADYKPRALSGGQRQRVAVARALVNHPKLILADEPTASLDKESSGAVVELLKELTLQEGCTVIMVTHDNRILERADRITNLVDGKIVSDVILREALTICEFLKKIELFKHLTPVEIANVAEHMQRRRYAADETVMRQGEVGEEVFLILDGAASVHVRDADEPEHEIAKLGVGDIFGEMALLTNEPRNATVRAVGELQTYCLGKEDFRVALDRSMTLRDQIRQIYFNRYRALRHI